MLVYANQTDEVAEGLPPFATIVLDAIPFQSVTTFCANNGAPVINVARIGVVSHNLDFMVSPPACSPVPALCPRRVRAWCAPCRRPLDRVKTHAVLAVPFFPHSVSCWAG